MEAPKGCFKCYAESPEPKVIHHISPRVPTQKYCKGRSWNFQRKFKRGFCLAYLHLHRGVGAKPPVELGFSPGHPDLPELRDLGLRNLSISLWSYATLGYKTMPLGARRTTSVTTKSASRKGPHCPTGKRPFEGVRPAHKVNEDQPAMDKVYVWGSFWRKPLKRVGGSRKRIA